MSPVREEPLLHMNRLTVFQGFAPQELRTLALVFEVKRLAEQDVLWKQGDPSTCFAIIVEGSLSVYQNLPDGRVHKMGYIGPNRMVGEVGLVDGGRRESSVVADRGGALVLTCRREDFDRLFWANNAFAYKLMDFVITDLSHRLREVLGQLDVVLTNPTEAGASMMQRILAMGRSVHESGEFPTMGGKAQLPAQSPVPKPQPRPDQAGPSKQK